MTPEEQQILASLRRPRSFIEARFMAGDPFSEPSVFDEPSPFSGSSPFFPKKRR
jgi:hypothetical protein